MTLPSGHHRFFQQNKTTEQIKINLFYYLPHVSHQAQSIQTHVHIDAYCKVEIMRCTVVQTTLIKDYLWEAEYMTHEPVHSQAEKVSDAEQSSVLMLSQSK